MTIRASLIASSLIAASLVSGAAQAALQGRDLNGSINSFEAYYDTDLNITWLADANYANTSGYDAYPSSAVTVDGKMSWYQATTWAANLVIVDTVNNITYDNWRLPTALSPDASCGLQIYGTSTGYNCGSEMGHLFYNELGGTADQSVMTSADPDLAKFTNLQAFAHYPGMHYYWYWSGSTNPSSPSYAFGFEFGDGFQTNSNKFDLAWAMAVSPGDVGAVPEAQTYVLMLAGLGLVGWRARRRG